MKKIVCMAMAAMMILSGGVLTGCGNEFPDEKEPSQKQELSFTSETLPRIDGATALAPYYEAMAAELLGMDLREARQYTQCNKTDGAYENLINGKVDMIFCSMPSSEQKAMAEEKGVAFETIPFLNGGFVFFVNKANPIESLSIGQLHDIYAGDITNWKDVGGPDLEIIAYQRPNNSGSQTGMYTYVIPEEEIMAAPTERKIGGMDGIIDAVATYENAEGAIGYTYYYYVTNMHASDKIKLVPIDGITPSDETIGDGTYPIINPSLMIINGDTPEDSPVRELAKWVLSDQGKKVAKENGYVPREN